MNFAHPNILFLGIIPLLYALWEIRRKGHVIALPVDNTTYKKGSFWKTLVLAANTLPAALLLLFIFILAKPQRRDKPETKRIMTNIEFCLDVSGSMTAQFGEGSRYDAAMKAISDFTENRRGDAFALTIFGNEVMRWVPLTKDLSAISNSTPFLRPEKLPGQFGGTEIGKGVRFCSSILKEQEKGDRLIILLSDGHSADLYGSEARLLGEQLKKDRIMIFAVHIGERAPEQLYELIEPTGGRVFAAGDKAGLQQVFQHIDSMHPVRLENRMPKMIENYRPFVLCGFCLGGLWLMCLFGLRFTPW